MAKSDKELAVEITLAFKDTWDKKAVDKGQLFLESDFIETFTEVYEFIKNVD